ncbi:hypothetical protein SAY87_029945 [Trapa incisa]|uniref:Uncharacterized protein n=1 Tax=Trapa incisa TaxID=236973 RepID=A0AAN7Q9K6_9MYRT|nr:hypothetical protein SAY87_029945 [Trapa incisa]
MPPQSPNRAYGSNRYPSPLVPFAVWFIFPRGASRSPGVYSQLAASALRRLFAGTEEIHSESTISKNGRGPASLSSLRDGIRPSGALPREVSPLDYLIRGSAFNVASCFRSPRDLMGCALLSQFPKKLSSIAGLAESLEREEVEEDGGHGL